MPDIYKEHGYKDREDYLRELAAENNADVETVFVLADLLGPSEDFDGLRNAIENWTQELG